MIAFRPDEALRLGEHEDAFRHERSRAALLTPAKQLILLQWLVILVVAIIETRVMWAPALLWGHSAWFDLTRMVEFDAAIRAGDYLPLWSPDLYHGYGSPLFQFYSPLVYFMTEIPVLAGIGIPTALKITQLLMLVASGGVMYHFAAARHVSRWAACFGAILYMVAPYRIVDLFVRHVPAEHSAFLWFPLLVWGTERFVAQRSRVGIVAGILATAGLILTHNVMALIGLPVCVAAGWILSARPKDWGGLLRAGYPAVIGVGCAAFFWWPALSGRIFTQAEESLTGGYFDYHGHFVEAWRFVSLAWGFGETGHGAAETMPLQIGLPHLLVAVLAFASIFGKWRTRWSVAGVAIMFGAVLMCHAVSEPIWTALPLLKYVQFPWRFLGLAVFGAAMCGAAVVDRIRAIQPRLEVPIFLAGLIVVLAAYFPYYTAVRFVAVDGRANTLTQVTSERVEAMRASSVLLPLDGIVTREKIRTVGERATSGDDFLPRGVEEKPTAPAPEPVSAVVGEVTQWDRPALNRYRAKISMREAGKVELHQFWFPGWMARLDGRATEVAPAGKAAVVSCDVPAGEHVVEFNYAGLPQRRAGMIVSLVSLTLAAAMTLVGKSRPEAYKGVSP